MASVTRFLVRKPVVGSLGSRFRDYLFRFLRRLARCQFVYFCKQAGSESRPTGLTASLPSVRQ